MFWKALNATLAVQRLQSQSEAEQATALVNQVLNPELSPSNPGNDAHADVLQYYQPNMLKQKLSLVILLSKVKRAGER